MIPHGNANRNFKGQLDTEIVQCFCRRHWIILLKEFVGFFIFLMALGVIGYYFKGIYDFFSQNSFFIEILAVGIVTLSAIYIHHFFLRIITYFLNIVIITNYRIVILDKSLYLHDSKDATDLAKIQDIQKEQNGIVRNVLKFGKLIITLSSSSTTKQLTCIPNPDYHFRKINMLKREYIKGRLGKHDRKPNKIESKRPEEPSFPEFKPEPIQRK